MKLVEMIQAMVDGKTVRGRIDGYRFRFNGEVLERKLPEEDGFRQISTPGVNMRERAQRILDGELIEVGEGIRVCMVGRRIEIRFYYNEFLSPDPKRWSFGSDSEYYADEPFKSSADVWDVVEGEE